MANPLTLAGIKNLFQYAAPWAGTTPTATPSGVFGETASAQAGLINPLKSFSAVLLNGQVRSFLFGNPAVIDALDLLNLQTQNGGTKSTGTITIGGTPAQNDTFTIVLGGISKTFTCGSNDITPTQTATDIASWMSAAGANGYTGLVTASALSGVITLTPQKSGTLANYTLSVSKSSAAGTISTSGATLTGGVNGKLFN